MFKKSRLIVIALGGNALNSPEGNGSYFEQTKNAKETAKEIAKVIKRGYRVAITHGNGPQVGNILLQQEYSRDFVSPLPLSVCGAESQGQIGMILTEALNNELKKLKLKKLAVAVITHVLVEKKDPAFQNPTKPIGPIYTPKEAEKLKSEGQTIKEIKPGAFRRVVPSPKPLEILEIDVIKKLLDSDLIPVAVGGGGIPVAKNKGKLEPVDAVIDKDLASEVLACHLKSDELIILTGVEKVAINFQKENEKLIDRLNVREAKRYLKEGQFPAGSMGPKIESAIKFVEHGGKKTIIAHLKDLTKAIAGNAGTEITRD